MPLPLYGSGGRCLRMIAAVSPTSCLEIPLTTTRVGCGTSNSIPSGAGVRTGGEVEVLALQLRAVADALDLETLLVAGGHALHHVRDERARQAVQRAMFA